MPKNNPVVYEPTTPGGAFNFREYGLSTELCTEVKGMLPEGVSLTESMKGGLGAALSRYLTGDEPHKYFLRWHQGDAPGDLDEDQLHRLMNEVEGLHAALNTVRDRIAAIDALVGARGTVRQANTTFADAATAKNVMHLFGPDTSPSQFADADEAAVLDRMVGRCDTALAEHDQKFRKRREGRPEGRRRKLLRSMVDECLRHSGVPAVARRRTRTGVRSMYGEVLEGVTGAIEQEAKRLAGLTS